MVVGRHTSTRTTIQKLQGLSITQFRPEIRIRMWRRLRRADGEFRWHQVRGEPLRDQQGNIIQWYGLSVDIDDAKKAEDQLRRSEAYLAEAQRLSHTGTAVFNDTTIIHWSDETYRIFGFDPRNGLPSREAALQTIHPDDREQAQEEARRAVRQKRDYKLEFRIVLPEEHQIYRRNCSS